MYRPATAHVAGRGAAQALRLLRIAANPEVSEFLKADGIVMIGWPLILVTERQPV